VTSGEVSVEVERPFERSSFIRAVLLTLPAVEAIPRTNRLRWTQWEGKGMKTRTRTRGTESKQEFVRWLRRQVADFADENAYTSVRHAFVPWVLTYVHELPTDSAVNASDTLQIGDGGLDAYFTTDDGLFYLVQAKYKDNPLEGRPEVPGLLRNLYTAFEILQTPIRAELIGTKIVRAAHQLKKAREHGARPVLEYFIAGTVSPKTRRELEGLVTEHPAQPLFKLYDINDLFGVYISKETNEIAEGNFEFILAAEQAIEFAPLDLAGVKEAFMVSLDLADFANTIADAVPRIFDANVRYDLGSRLNINAEIRKTLRDPDRREGFALYNNGLTVVAREAKFLKNGKALRLRAPQIVNGCQTASAIVDERHHIEKGQAELVAKVVVVDSDADGEKQSLKISETTNSQNPIKAADLKANDTTQKAIQTSFDLMDPPWYYERKRGAWNSLTDFEQRKYRAARGKPRSVTKAEVGQCWRSFSGDPIGAVLRNEEMWTNETVYPLVFDRDRGPNLYLLAVLVWRDFWSLTSKRERDRLKVIAGWIQDPQEYVAHIRPIKALWVSNLTFLFGKLLQDSDALGKLNNDRARSVIAVLLKDPKSFDRIRATLLTVADQWQSPLRDAGRNLKAAIQEEATPEKWLQLLRQQLAILRIEPADLMPEGLVPGATLRARTGKSAAKRARAVPRKKRTPGTRRRRSPRSGPKKT